jgi:crossover junction endodeoxyribonuclease RuvC
MATNYDKNPSTRLQILGIDPGFTGAVAIYDGHQKSVVAVIDMPTSTSATNGKRSVDARKLAEFLRPFQKSLKFAVIEAVHAGPRDGVVSAFSFGQGFGTVLGVLGTLEIPTRFAVPSVWKKALNLSSYKRESIDLARRTFPNSAHEFRLAKHNGKAEACLLAWYGERLAGFQSSSSDFSNLL